MQCIQICDNTPGCVDVSYIEGTPGPCFLKGSVGPNIPAERVLGGRRIAECTFASSRIKLHRKRVVLPAWLAPVPQVPQGPPTVAPGWIFTSQNTATTTVTATATSTRTRFVQFPG